MRYNHPTAKRQPSFQSMVPEDKDREIQNAPLTQNTEQLPANPLFMHPIHAKMVLGGTNDVYEREADRAAKQVVAQLRATSDVANSEPPNLDSELESSPIVSTLVQPQGNPGVDASMAVDSEIESAIRAVQAEGTPLQNNVRTGMEQSFGADFSQVRVHDDNTADRLNQSLQAKAFTTGTHIFFCQGAYAPTSQQGQELLAHELTHVVQQNSSPLQHRIQRTIIGRDGHPLSEDELTAKIKQTGLSSETEARVRARHNNDLRQYYFAQAVALEQVSSPTSSQLDATSWHAQIEREMPKTSTDLAAVYKTSSSWMYPRLFKIGGENPLQETDYHKEYESSDAMVEKTLRGNAEVYKNTRSQLLESEKLPPEKRSSELEAKEKQQLKNIESLFVQFNLGSPSNPQWSNLSKGYKTHYLDETQREQFQLTFTLNEITKRVEVTQGDKPFDTSDSFGIASGAGSGIYVMDPAGKFYAGPHRLGEFHHSSLLAGGAVAGAGELQVQQGKLLAISNKSGHYRPPLSSMTQVLAELQDQYVDLTNVKLLDHEGKEQPALLYESDKREKLREEHYEKLMEKFAPLWDDYESYSPPPSPLGDVQSTSLTQGIRPINQSGAAVQPEAPSLGNPNFYSREPEMGDFPDWDFSPSSEPQFQPQPLTIASGYVPESALSLMAPPQASHASPANLFQPQPPATSSGYITESALPNLLSSFEELQLLDPTLQDLEEEKHR